MIIITHKSRKYPIGPRDSTKLSVNIECEFSDSPPVTNERSQAQYERCQPIHSIIHQKQQQHEIQRFFVCDHEQGEYK